MLAVLGYRTTWVVIVSLCGFFVMQDAHALEKVRLLIPVKIIDEALAPFVVAKEKGYFADEGYDVSLVAVGGSTESAIQLSAGNAEVAMSSPGEALVGIQSGKFNVRYFYDLNYNSVWSISVPVESPIKTVAELKGKKLGVFAMGSAGITMGRAFAQEAGLNPEKDISFLPIGVGAQAVASVRQKLVDAIVFWDVALLKFKFAGLGLRQLPVSESLRTLPDVSLLARNETIEQNPKLLVGLGRAVAKGYDYCLANPTAAVMITWKAYPENRSRNPDAAAAIKEGVEVLEARLSTAPMVGGKRGPLIDADWQRFMQFLVDQRVIPAPAPIDRVITNRFIDEINKYDRASVILDAQNADLSKLK